jgi:hypothetical protein
VFLFSLAAFVPCGGESLMTVPRLRKLALLVLLLIAGKGAGVSQTGGNSLTIPAGTPLEARLAQHAPMKVGTPLHATVAYPIYVHDVVALPAGTRLTGSIIALQPDKPRRVDARLNADLTPFHHPVVRFDHAELANGTSIALLTSQASDGAPLLHLTAPLQGKKRSLIGEQWDGLRQRMNDTKQAILGPDKGDRLLQLLYSQLPYHPERVETGTAWSCVLTEAIKLQPATGSHSAALIETKNQDPTEKPSLLLHAYLNQELSSKDAKAGQSFNATIAEPLRGPNDSLLVPEGAVLVGAVTRAHPAKSFGRGGVLRFDFRQLRLPEGERKQINGSLAGTDSAAGTKLQMDAEGEVKPQSQSKVLVPLALGLLASRPLDSDSSQLAGATVGSNGLGFAGRIVGMASASRNLAAGIGFYGTAVSVYRRWIQRGKDVEFPKYNRIDVEISERTGRELTPR